MEPVAPFDKRQPPHRSQRWVDAASRSFTRYVEWVSTLSWKRFFLLAILAIVGTGILSEMPPFSSRWGDDRRIVQPGAQRKEPAVVVQRGKGDGHTYEIRIDERGVRISPKKPASAASSAASSAEAAASDLPPVPPIPPEAPEGGVTIKLPPGADTDEIKRAIEEAQSEIEDVIADTKPRVVTVRAFRLGDYMVQFLMVLIVITIIAKVMGAGQKKAEAVAEAATEMAESEALKRQVVEARMAAMQAQVEPHFLFNTLASIDHLIETDPARASKMQKNLITLLRASMPTLREADTNLGRELAVIRPYLEILKVRMEERLQTDIRVSDGLLSAEFPPMMLQSLVENAIKHGLEPKAEGGTLTVSAEIQHGKLAVTVADSGLGFGKAATAGTGVGLNNIRERLQLLYGNKAQLGVAENAGGGTAVTITVPYLSKAQPGAAK